MDPDMKRSVLAILLVGVIAAATLLPHTAEARHGRRGAFIGGLAAGALIGGVLAAPAYAYPRYYYPPYAYPPYAYGPVYYGYPPRCFRRLETRWNGYRWYRARVLVCY
jgi:hypothetical protein